jgi:hypothetical protein
MANPKEPGSITQDADESRERVAEVSNVSRTINQMQKEVDQKVSETKLNVGDYDRIQEVQNSMLKVLSSLSGTIAQIGRGFGKVATGTATAGKDLISQYGKAISEDISFNKQNVIAMSLARATPLFGYFASKFMQTDVFRSAAAKMRGNISEALGTAASKFKEGVGGFFDKLKITSRKERPIKTIRESAEEPIKKKKVTEKPVRTPAEEIPKMQRGGYVERAGLAMVHPAEVVMPIEKVLSKIDESISVSRELATITKKAQLRTMANLSTYVKGVEKLEKVGMFKSFLRAMHSVQTRYTEPANIRMLRAVLAIQDSMGATLGTWPQVWQKMLVEHPTFRNIMFSLKAMKKLIGTPIDLVYQVFKSRGGYQGHLSKAKNPMQAAAENIGLVYTEGMWRLDNIAKFTRATAEATRDLSSAVTGKKYSPLEGMGTRVWSLFSLARKIVNFGGKWLPPVIGRVLLGERGWKAGKGIGEILTEDRTIFLEKIFKKEMTGIYGRGGTVEALPGREKLADRLTSIPYQVFPSELLEDAKLHRALPVIDTFLVDLYQKQEQVQSEILDYNKNQLEISEINTALLEMANKDTNEYREKERKESPVLLLAERAESLINMSQDEAKKDKNMLGMTKNIAKSAEESLEVQKQMNLRQKIKSVFNVFSGTFGSIKSLLSMIPAFIPFIFGGGLKKVATRLIGGSISSSLKKVFSRKLLSSAFRGALKSVFSPKMWTTIGRTMMIPIKSLWTKGVVGSILPMIKKLIPLFRGFIPVLSKLLGPIGALAGAFTGGLAIGKVIDKMFGITEKFQSRLDRLDEKAQAAADAVREQQKTIFEKATTAGLAPSEEQFQAKRMVKIQTLGAKDREKNLGIWGRGNIDIITTAQKAYMNENIDEYLKYTTNDIQYWRNKWNKEGKFGGKFVLTNAEKYGRKREAAFLKYLQANAKPLSETEISSMYGAYEKQWKERHPVRGTTYEVVSTVAEKAKEYKDVAIKTGLAAADRAMGVMADTKELARNTVDEAMAQSKKISKTITETSKAALEGTKNLAGTVSQGFSQSTNNISSTIQNMTNINNNNNDGAARFSQFSQSVLRGETEA